MLGINAFLDPSAAGIMQADNRTTCIQCHIQDLTDFFGIHFAKRAAKNSKIICININ